MVLALPIDSVVESHIKFGIGRSPRHQTLASIETFAIKLTVTGLQQLSQIPTLLQAAVSKNKPRGFEAQLRYMYVGSVSRRPTSTGLWSLDNGIAN